MEDMIWMGKRHFSQKARNRQSCDVSVRKSITQNKVKARFTLRNGLASTISETDYVQYAIHPKLNRVYFKSGDHDTGLKMSSQKKMLCDNRYVTINKEDDAKQLLSFIGDYNIAFDSERGLYYIQK